MRKVFLTLCVLLSPFNLMASEPENGEPRQDRGDEPENLDQDIEVERLISLEVQTIAPEESSTGAESIELRFTLTEKNKGRPVYFKAEYEKDSPLPQEIPLQQTDENFEPLEGREPQTLILDQVDESGISGKIGAFIFEVSDVEWD